MKSSEIITRYSDDVESVKSHLRNSMSMLDLNLLSLKDLEILKGIYIKYHTTNKSTLKDISDTVKDVDSMNVIELKQYLKLTLHRIDYSRMSDSDLEIMKELFSTYRKGLPLGINWGTKVIPKDKWIDVNKKYTFNGKRVINLEIKLFAEDGGEYTYPVKGSVVVKEKPFTTKYMIWSLDGRENVCFSDDELKEVK